MSSSAVTRCSRFIAAAALLATGLFTATASSGNRPNTCVVVVVAACAKVASSSSSNDTAAAAAAAAATTTGRFMGSGGVFLFSGVTVDVVDAERDFEVTCETCGTKFGGVNTTLEVCRWSFGGGVTSCGGFRGGVEDDAELLLRLGGFDVKMGVAERLIVFGFGASKGVPGGCCCCGGAFGFTT